MLRKAVTFGFLVSILFIFTVGTGYAEKVKGVTEDTIKIGVIEDLTGPVAAIGIPVSEAHKNYFRNINEKNGIHGRRVKLVVEDTGYTIPRAIAGFKKLLYRDQVFAILGPGSTGETVALLSQIEKKKVPTISLSCAEAITYPFKRYVFTHFATYENSTKLVFDYVIKDLKKKKPRVAIVYTDNEMGKSSLRGARSAAKFYSLELVREEILNLTDTDATSQALNLKKAKADYVIVAGAVPTAVSILKDSKRFGFSPVFFGTYATVDEAVIRMVGNAARNWFVLFCYGLWDDESPGIVEMKRITYKYHPDSKKRSGFYTMGWTMAIIMAEGMKRAGRDLSREGLVDGIESIKDFDTKGVTGILDYSSTSHRGGEEVAIFKADLKKNSYKRITDWKKPSF